MTHRSRDIIRRVVCLIAVLIVSGSALCDSVTIYDEVYVGSDIVKLSDVAILRGEGAMAFGDVEVGRFNNVETTLSITINHIRDCLTRSGIHWGKVTCRGMQRVSVSRIVVPVADVPSTQKDRTGMESGVLTSEVGTVVDGMPVAVTGRTMQECLADWVKRRLGVDGSRIRIKWHGSKDGMWQRSAAFGQFAFETDADVLLGQVPIVVRQYRDGHEIFCQRVSVRIEQLRPVLVLNTTVNRGRAINADDIHVEQRWVNRLSEQMLSDPAQVVGKNAGRVLREGSALTVGDIKMPRLIRRGQIVTVRCVSGSLILKTEGRAGADGCIGQLIEIRDDRTRQIYTARVSGHGEAMMIVDQHDHESHSERTHEVAG